MDKTIIYFVTLWTLAASYRMNNKLKVGLGNPKQSENLLDPLPEEQWFNQKLNHFDPTDETTWQQVI